MEQSILESLLPINNLSLPQTSRDDLRGYLEYPHAGKELYINKHPCLLRDSNPVSMAQPSDRCCRVLVPLKNLSPHIEGLMRVKTAMVRNIFLCGQEAHRLSSDLFSVWIGNSSWIDSCLNRFVECAKNEIAVVPDFHKLILFSDEAHIWLNGYVNKQNCRIWIEANPQMYVKTPLHPEKLTVWCALWAGGILLQKR
ncbi:transposase [Trichonephila clavipes]|nr:transposase [Trichonephila clavipes]